MIQPRDIFGKDAPRIASASSRDDGGETEAIEPILPYPLALSARLGGHLAGQGAQGRPGGLAFHRQLAISLKRMQGDPVLYELTGSAT